jgi:hypothetical protein
MYDPSVFTASNSCYGTDSYGCHASSISAANCPSGFPMPGLCPSAGLIGCCIVSGYANGSTEVEDADCIYNSMQSPDESECKSSGGTWTTNPL